MSTFDGNVAEFPGIQIDYFRRDPTRPAVAYFLSHVHSDHRQGLESFKGSFIYCSLATKEILLRLEKYPHRMNFVKGTLETRVQSFAHLKPLLKSIPLETPTMIELFPGRSIRVTLFDANHCVGAVMFLVEGDGKAILYTGDIRSEAWWVNSLARNPILLPFVHGEGQRPLRCLDNIYLDTTYATKADRYRGFPTKADGISELLTKVSKYPKETKFYVDSWTFGYEEVWQALSNFLNTQIHVDDYRYKLYLSLANTLSASGRPIQAFQLIGSACGNHYQEGCLTTRNSSVHSCEEGTDCDIWDQEFVRITPIVSRHDGMDLLELGAGGGQGDLKPQHTIEMGDIAGMQQLKALCFTNLSGEPELLNKFTEMIDSITNHSTKNIELTDSNLVQQLPGAESDADDIPIISIVPLLTKHILRHSTIPRLGLLEGSTEALPRHILFPYSRHSSYRELCHLLETFRPKDIHPCTVDRQNWTQALSMSNLFGHLYDGNHVFKHDEIMQRSSKRRPSSSMDGKVFTSMQMRPPQPEGTSNSTWERYTEPEKSQRWSQEPAIGPKTARQRHVLVTEQIRLHASGDEKSARTERVLCRKLEPKHTSRSINPSNSINHTFYSEAQERMALRQDAYNSALGNKSSWFDISLTSVYGHQREEEL